jgi:hypothetical protein
VIECPFKEVVGSQIEIEPTIVGELGTRFGPCKLDPAQEARAMAVPPRR